VGLTSHKAISAEVCVVILGSVVDRAASYIFLDLDFKEAAA